MFARVFSMDDISDWISMFESDGKGVPVLVRHYMKLGGKFLGFNVDAKFSNVLDGLLLVDLREAKPELLARYLGKEGVCRIPPPAWQQINQTACQNHCRVR